MAAVGNGSCSTRVGFVRGGGGTFAFLPWSTLYASRIATPRFDAADERALDDLPQVVRQVEVVDRDLERRRRAADEVREHVRRALRGLRSVGERVDVDQDAFARISALYARFAAW